VREEHKRLAFD